jgi:chromate transporter
MAAPDMNIHRSDIPAVPATAGASATEVFSVFLKLGLTSFGGPIAHLGYFHRELIARRKWLTEDQYVQLLALGQFLPGPASSQVGFLIGLLRAGWTGAGAAFAAFTLPSALLLFALAHLMPLLRSAVGDAALHGLKLVAVVVVAQAVLSMLQRMAPDVARKSIVAIAAVVVVISHSSAASLLVVALSAPVGMWLCHSVSSEGAATFELSYGRRFGALLLILSSVLLIGAFATASDSRPLLAIASAFYRAGAMVFGGGHVVLPLLQDAVVTPGWISPNDFLTGYGAAQAIPGPMFSIAAFLGARLHGSEGGVVGAGTCLLALFIPGLLFAAGALPFWQKIASSSAAMNAVAGVNAAVIGLLVAALYDPLWLSAVLTPIDIAIVLVGFLLVTIAPSSVLYLIAWCVAASLTSAWLHY